MSRIATPAEKIMATVGIYKALSTELGLPNVSDYTSEVHAALIDAAVKIAMYTDTRDMGIIGPPAIKPRVGPTADPNPLKRDNLDGTTGVEVSDLAQGDHFAYPDDPGYETTPG